MLKFKKGDLEIRFIVLLAIAIVVMIIALLAVYGASGKFGENIATIWGDIMKFWKPTPP
jgi:uncharacterized protein (UPF0333 family)